MNISCSAAKEILDIPLEGRAIIAGYWSPKYGLSSQPTIVQWRASQLSSLTPLSNTENPDLDLFHWESYYLQPGWIDCHVHLALDSLDFYQCLKNWENPSLIQKNIQVYLQNYLRLGIVAIRDGGDLPGYSWLARNNVREGTWLGPRVISVREAVNRKGMYGRFLGRGFAGISDWHRELIDFYGQGLDQLKVIVSGLIRFDNFKVVGPTQWTVAELSEIVQTAHQRGISVMAHASGEDGISTAIAARVDSIEHGYYMTAEHLNQMKEYGIAWIPTVAPIGNILKYPTDRYSSFEIDTLRRILETQLTMIYEAYKRKVRIGVGTDAGAYLVPHGESLFDEMDWLVQAGIPKLDVYSMATQENAGIVRQKDLGRLEIGTPMNLLQLTKGNVSLERNRI
ncbi:amidohydrolase, imidazolonepropionase [Desulfosporosinus acidiphilus SJ4]|uniref:Amidohydrolase, imidazolonepropionase n=1 Tax=Desulfosporosinus acidiphilus (strain DSM 22704 / JCM 16185 / SJ4) TaxID=646529 RepID=I4D8L4_DESAJ|nr:amidohydrolase family protein [Desulfosporosinus acidiphilus]AFM42138.1 amidohydrolase, imidazolonepropionase [Desulfosporosinus acidiphilus SJ4]